MVRGALLDIETLSEGTVRNHQSACKQKAAVRNRTEAVRAAQLNGWL